MVLNDRLACLSERDDRHHEVRYRTVLFQAIAFSFILASHFEMIHYTCDRCRQEIDPTQSSRYTILIEVQRSEEEWNDDEAIDHLDALHQAIEADVADGHDLPEIMDHDIAMPRAETDEDCLGVEDPAELHDDSIATGEVVTQSFDLCESCYRRYRSNPLGRERNLKLHFSDN